MARPAVWASVVVTAALVAACASQAPSPTTSSARPPTPLASAPASPSAPEPATVSPASAPAESAASTVASTDAPTVRDDSLLAILPPDVDGNAVTVEEESFAEAATDAAFATSIERAAFAIVTSPVDLASGLVVKPRDGIFDGAFFASWRETYDEGACAQAGGVATNAETSLGGRTVFITTCAGGLRVYHAYVEGPGVIVSLFSLGEGRYGERLLAAIRP